MTLHKRLAVLGNGDAEMKRSAGVANLKRPLRERKMDCLHTYIATFDNLGRIIILPSVTPATTGLDEPPFSVIFPALLTDDQRKTVGQLVECLSGLSVR